MKTYSHLLICLFCLCCGCMMQFSDDCREGYEDFSSWRADNFHRLAEKYELNLANFDTETIYDVQDLGRVISMILDSTHEIKYEIIREYHDDESKQFRTVFLIEGKEYEFETSSQTDYIDFDWNFKLLKRIAEDTESDNVFDIPWFPGDQTMTIVFAPREVLAKAIDEGFPLTLEGEAWRWNHRAEWKDISRIIVPFHQELEQDKFRQQMLETVADLNRKDQLILPITLERIFITCLYDNARLHVIVDGNDLMNSSCELEGNTISGYPDLWNVLFLYMISNHYGKGELDLVLRNGDSQTISSKELKEKIRRAQLGD